VKPFDEQLRNNHLYLSTSLQHFMGFSIEANGLIATHKATPNPQKVESLIFAKVVIAHRWD